MMIDTEQAIPDLNEIADKVKYSKDNRLSNEWEKYWYGRFKEQIAGAKMTIDALQNQRDQLLSAMAFNVEREPLKIVLEREKFDKLANLYTHTNQTADLNMHPFEHPLSFVYGDNNELPKLIEDLQEL